MAKRPLNTACGPANAAALERLQESFETQRLLDAVDQINHVAARVEDACFRQDLLRLHAMAHTLINGAPPTMSGQETIWKLAGGLAGGVGRDGGRSAIDSWPVAAIGGTGAGGRPAGAADVEEEDL